MDVASTSLAKRVENSEQGELFMPNKLGTLRQEWYR